jgi:hypothetical protein
MRQTTEPPPSRGLDGVCFLLPACMRNRYLTLLLPRPAPETFRNPQKTTNDRPKTGEGALLNQENRRPPHDRNGSRNAASTSNYPRRPCQIASGCRLPFLCILLG